MDSAAAISDQYGGGPPEHCQAENFPVKLDLCTATMLPQIEKLLQSKCESYVQTRCTSLKLILQWFLPLIPVTAPPSVGVDTSQEERLHKF